MMGGTCFTSFYSSFIQDLHSTGSPGVPLLKAEYTKKRRRMAISVAGMVFMRGLWCITYLYRNIQCKWESIKGGNNAGSQSL